MNCKKHGEVIGVESRDINSTQITLECPDCIAEFRKKQKEIEKINERKWQKLKEKYKNDKK